MTAAAEPDLALDAALPLVLEFLTVAELGRLAAVCSATANYALHGGDWAERFGRDRLLLPPLRDPAPSSEEERRPTEVGVSRTSADWRALYCLDVWRERYWLGEAVPPSPSDTARSPGADNDDDPNRSRQPVRNFTRQRLKGHTDGGEQGIRQSDRQ